MNLESSDPNGDAANDADIDATTEAHLQAAVFRRLVAHLQSRTDVQNIDLMELAGFCRNCLSRWYAEAAAEAGFSVDKESAREYIYGMPYAEWKARHQTGPAIAVKSSEAPDAT